MSTTPPKKLVLGPKTKAVGGVILAVLIALKIWFPQYDYVITPVMDFLSQTTAEEPAQ